MSRHYFIGLQVPRELGILAEEYRKAYNLYDHYKVLPHHNDLHITLLFLGGVQDSELPIVIRRLQEETLHISFFTLHVNGLSYFGSHVEPRVVYLSLANNQALNTLQQTIHESISPLLSLSASYRFVPHITIAKKRKTHEKIDIHKQTIKAINVLVDSFALFTIYPNQSPKYEAIQTFQLQGNNNSAK